MSNNDYALKRTIRYIQYEYCEKCECDYGVKNEVEFDKTIEHFENIDDMKEFVKKNKEYINPDMSLKILYPDYQLKFEDYECHKYEECKTRDGYCDIRCHSENWRGESEYGNCIVKFETTRIEIVKDRSRNFVSQFE
jgi:hypothetical protein